METYDKIKIREYGARMYTHQAQFLISQYKFWDLKMRHIFRRTERDVKEARINLKFAEYNMRLTIK